MNIESLAANLVIFSDDPDFTEKLVDKIERLKKRQGLVKRTNQLIRKADHEGLADLGFFEETIAKLLIEDLPARLADPRLSEPGNGTGATTQPTSSN
jgi:hypothetical protein